MFGRRRVPAGEGAVTGAPKEAGSHDLPGCSAAAAAAVEAGMQVEEGLVEHSRRALDAGGQRVHLRIAAVQRFVAVRSCAGAARGVRGAAASASSSASSGTCSAGTSVNSSTGATGLRAPLPVGVEGSSGGRRVGKEEAAVLNALGEELLPARVLPIFAWQVHLETPSIVREHILS